LVRGDDVRIFDHDLAFFHKGTLGWRVPWQQGSLSYGKPGAAHLL
jgi:hypothetical protein